MSVLFSWEYEEETPCRLDTLIQQFLSDTQHQHSRSQIQKWIKAGAVLVNGKPVLKSGTPVKPNDSIELQVIAREEVDIPPFEHALSIVYEDESLLIIEKEAGLVVHPGAGNPRDTLLNALVHHYKLGDGSQQSEALPRLGIVHRLDKDTSGLLVVAKTLQAHESLSQQFADKTAGRTYYGLVHLKPRRLGPMGQEDSGSVEASIGRDPKERRRMAVSEQGGRSATTHWKVIERFQHAALASFSLETGRTHQIRVHCQSIGHPLLADPVYYVDMNIGAEMRRQLQLLGRQALHAYHLEFNHPGSQERVSFQSELPEDFEQLLGWLREHDSGNT